MKKVSYFIFVSSEKILECFNFDSHSSIEIREDYSIWKKVPLILIKESAYFVGFFAENIFEFYYTYSHSFCLDTYLLYKINSDLLKEKRISLNDFQLIVANDKSIIKTEEINKFLEYSLTFIKGTDEVQKYKVIQLFSGIFDIKKHDCKTFWELLRDQNEEGKEYGIYMQNAKKAWSRLLSSDFWIVLVMECRIVAGYRVNINFDDVKRVVLFFIKALESEYNERCENFNLNFSDVSQGCKVINDQQENEDSDLQKAIQKAEKNAEEYLESLLDGKVEAYETDCSDKESSQVNNITTISLNQSSNTNNTKSETNKTYVSNTGSQSSNSIENINADGNEILFNSLDLSKTNEPDCSNKESSQVNNITTISLNQSSNTNNTKIETNKTDVSNTGSPSLSNTKGNNIPSHSTHSSSAENMQIDSTDISIIVGVLAICIFFAVGVVYLISNKVEISTILSITNISSVFSNVVKHA